jgi:hypothetical protein
MACLKHYYISGPGPSVIDRIAPFEKRTRGVNVSRFHIGCDAIEDNWLRQTLTIDLEMLHKDEPA